MRLRADLREQRIFDARMQLAQYYEAQLKLFAEMCLDRSYNCIEKLELMFPHDLLVAGIKHEALPHSLRACFVTLCTRLYIDRQGCATNRLL